MQPQETRQQSGFKRHAGRSRSTQHECGSWLWLVTRVRAPMCCCGRVWGAARGCWCWCWCCLCLLFKCCFVVFFTFRNVFVRFFFLVFLRFCVFCAHVLLCLFSFFLKIGGGGSFSGGCKKKKMGWSNNVVWCSLSKYGVLKEWSCGGCWNAEWSRKWSGNDCRTRGSPRHSLQVATIVERERESNSKCNNSSWQVVCACKFFGPSACALCFSYCVEKYFQKPMQRALTKKRSFSTSRTAFCFTSLETTT